MRRLGGPRRGVSTACSASLLHEAIRDDCVDGIIPPPVVSLESGIIWSGEGCYQSPLRWTLRRAGLVGEYFFKAMTLKLALDVDNSLFGSPLLPDLLFEHPFQPLLLASDLEKGLFTS